MKSNIQYLIYRYISYCFDELGVIPSEDEVYLRFQKHFDNGTPFEIVEEEIRNFIAVHNMKDIEIRWEGKLFGNHIGRAD
ncbi:hypothetical protein LC048_13745 [Mesobacillus subterraneus]|uniref:hypothetical protein n=1 Tax=Mesobacillus subterraneus TaxID=285983 RepID=UPI001CFDEBFC|nr:hypothetical protein [Mesobacillus subterraneus]WLR53586.1 hypothetical protein LC048_13745 [Mesobacillus subterraneus]